jgi:hypothetical protein
MATELPPTFPNLAGRDPIAHAISATLRKLDGEVDKGGWDRVPTLWAIRRAAMETSEQGLAIALLVELVPTGDLFAQRGHPTDMLAALAVTAGENPGMISPVDLLAFAFVAEAWSVASPKGDKRSREGADARQLHLHPDRVEIRMVNAVDTGGLRYVHIIPRDPAVGERMEVVVSGQDTAHAAFRGYVMDSLAHLIDACA